jgi:uncharacterized protein YndB with AHSA1/START domain
MSCNDSEVIVERHVELPASPETVWEALPELLGDDVELTPEIGGALHARDTDRDGDRVGVVIEAVPAERLTFQWTSVEGDDAPSEVEISLEPAGFGTILHLRETRLDGEHMVRAAFLALARA